MDIDTYVTNNYDVVIEGEGMILKNNYNHDELVKDGLIQVVIGK